MKKFFYLVSLTFPFFIIYFFWFLSAFSFSIREIFQTSHFWVLTVIYYAFIVWLPISFLASGEAERMFRDYDDGNRL